MFKYKFFKVLLVFFIAGSCLAEKHPCVFDDYLCELVGKRVVSSQYKSIKLGTAEHRKYVHGNITKLNDYYQNEASEKKNPHTASDRMEFENKKSTLIKMWEEKNKMSWPAGYHAHHIIPISHKGPNEWWNLIPLTVKQHKTVHAAQSRLSKLFP